MVLYGDLTLKKDERKLLKHDEIRLNQNIL